LTPDTESSLSWPDPIGDIKRAVERAMKQEYRPILALHHPKCKAVETQSEDDCNCIPHYTR